MRGGSNFTVLVCGNCHVGFRECNVSEEIVIRR